MRNFANKWFHWDSESIFLTGQVLGCWRPFHSSIDLGWLTLALPASLQSLQFHSKASWLQRRTARQKILNSYQCLKCPLTILSLKIQNWHVHNVLILKPFRFKPHHCHLSSPATSSLINTFPWLMWSLWLAPLVFVLFCLLVVMMVGRLGFLNKIFKHSQIFWAQTSWKTNF